MAKFGFENLGHLFIRIGDTSNALTNNSKAFTAGLDNEALQKRNFETIPLESLSFYCRIFIFTSDESRH